MKTIEVTQDDINRGRKNNCYACPIARAIQRERLFECFEVGETVINIVDMEGAIERTIRLPRNAKNFIKTFDSGGVVQPFSFPIDID